MLSVDGANYSTRFVPAVGKPAAQLRASIETPLHAGARALALRLADVGQSELVVNVFDGGPGTRVRYGISGITREPRPLQRVACPDPHVARVFAEHAELQKPWMRALSSSHIWRARLPSDLRPGAYCAAVEAENEYGHKLSTHLVFEVVPDFAT
jgi:C terminal of Calcineurin-like phosphoesterase